MVLQGDRRRLHQNHLALGRVVRHRTNSPDEHEAEHQKPTPWLRGFWGTVTSITLADIAFSIDSILAAVATSGRFPAHFGDRGKLLIVLTGGILGIITMRFVVRYFLILLERFPGLEAGAYYLVAWIGLKLLISGFHQGELLGFHIPEPLFWVVMLGITAVSLVVKRRARRGSEAQLAESLDLLDSAGQESGEAQGDQSEIAGELRRQSERRTEEPLGTEKAACPRISIRDEPFVPFTPSHASMRPTAEFDSNSSRNRHEHRAELHQSTRVFSLLTVLGATPHWTAISAGVLPINVS